MNGMISIFTHPPPPRAIIGLIYTWSLNQTRGERGHACFMATRISQSLSSSPVNKARICASSLLGCPVQAVLPCEVQQADWFRE